MNKKIRILVVEDSFLTSKIIVDIISSDPGLEVVAEARDGQDALEKAFSIVPDVITLDINLPLLDGLAVLSAIMKRHPMRVVMLSAYTREGAAATIRALELGAVDFIAKPSDEISLGLPKLKEEIISKLKLAAGVEVSKFLPEISKVIVSRKVSQPKIKKIVVIGASTGGVRVILDIMRQIPLGLSAAFLIVQHMPKGFTLTFAESISWQSRLKAKESEDGDALMPDKAFVAPAEHHMVLEKTKEEIKIRLNQDDSVNFVRPSIDVTMSSAASVFGSEVIGVILTGMGRDGLEGARAIKEKGGLVIVQDEKTSSVWGMPGVVYKAGLADMVLPVSDIPQAIVEKINQETPGAGMLSKAGQ